MTDMRKLFYLATRKDRGEEAAALLDTLQSNGWERTYTWSPQDGSSTDKYREIPLKELEAIGKADVLVVLLPGGYGTHVEIGAALALGKPVVLHSPDRKTLESPYPCVFHYHPSVKVFISEVMDVNSVLSELNFLRQIGKDSPPVPET